jgi:hypothetical protein
MSSHSEELRDLELFQRLFCGTTGEFTHGGNDFPDFGDEKSGLCIEHTRAFLGPQTDKGNLAKAVEGRQNRACAQITRELALRMLPAYEVRIWFVEDPKEPVKLADELLVALEPQLRTLKPLKLSRENAATVSLPSEIWEIEFIPLTKQHNVYRTDGTRLVQGPTSSVQRAIDPKNLRLRKFIKKRGRATYNSFWLLVVADSWNMELGSLAAEHEYTSDFDRTFFLQRGPERLLSLKTING